MLLPLLMSMTTPDVNNWECFSKAWGHFIWHKEHFNTTLSKEKNELFLPEVFAEKQIFNSPGSRCS